MTAFWRVRNWEHFQHYGKRTPPWVKVYGALLDTYEFTELPDADKAHWLCLYLLASRTGNKIPNNPAWVATKIGALTPVNLELLARQGLLEPFADASITPPAVLAPVEKSREEKKREEKMTDDVRSFAQAVTVAANGALRDNPAMRQEGQLRPLRTDLALPVVKAWLEAGIAREHILAEVAAIARRFKPTKVNVRIVSFGYFDAAVRQSWQDKQDAPPPAPARGFREVA